MRYCERHKKKSKKNQIFIEICRKLKNLDFFCIALKYIATKFVFLNRETVKYFYVFKIK